MNTIRLVFPTTAYEQKVMELRDEFLLYETRIPGSGDLEKYQSYTDWLAKVVRNHDGPVEPGRVAATQYLGVNSSGHVVGLIQLRHGLNQYLEDYGGHIGYCVRPSERRKGYAGAMLVACLKHAAELGISKALITCDDDNVASENVIRKYGGTYEDTRDEPNSKPKKRFWVPTSSNLI